MQNRQINLVTLVLCSVMCGCLPVGDGEDPAEPAVPVPSQATLRAAEAKRYTIYAEAGDTIIANSTVPDSNSDVDLYLYDTNDNPVGSSINAAGQPDNIRVRAGSSGYFNLDVVNIMPQPVTCRLASQRIEGGNSSPLNGVYRITTLDGQQVPSEAQEKWVFRNGELVSRYVFVQGSVFGVQDDFEVWADHTSGARTEYYWLDYYYLMTTTSSNTNVRGGHVDFAFSASVIYSGAGEFGTLEADNAFSGTISSNGRQLSGQVDVSLAVNGASGSYGFSVALVRVDRVSVQNLTDDSGFRKF
jgi:hypothetical protein